MHCKECGNSFSLHYFSRHWCTKGLVEHGTSSKKNDIEWNEIVLEKEEKKNVLNIDINSQNGTTGDQVKINNDGKDDGDELYNEEVSEEVFYKLFEEATFSHETNPPESQDDNKGVYLVWWICLFLSYWKYSINITESAVEFALKFLKLFFQVLQPTDEIILDTFCNTFPGTLYSFYQNTL